MPPAGQQNFVDVRAAPVVARKRPLPESSVDRITGEARMSEGGDDRRMKSADSSENIMVRETDLPMVRLITVNKSDRDRWRYVYRRVTYDRDTGTCLSDESVEGLTNAQLYRELDQPRRLRVEFHLRNEPVSKEGEDDVVADLLQSYYSDDETELERMVRIRRTDGERYLGERFIRQMRWIQG